LGYFPHALLCCSGRRRWSIENGFLTEQQEKKREVRGSATKLLRGFCADQAVELEAGDMLYLPPRMPHEGTLSCADFIVRAEFRLRPGSTIC
jgi:ribosomal protein L16 Arg81 hydroxylase